MPSTLRCPLTIGGVSTLRFPYGVGGFFPWVDKPVTYHEVVKRDAAVQDVGVAVEVPPVVRHTTHQVCDEAAVPFLPSLDVCYSRPDDQDVRIGGNTAYHLEV